MEWIPDHSSNFEGTGGFPSEPCENERGEKQGEARISDLY